METSSGERSPVEQLAEDFVARRRRGEQPRIEEYTTRYPELADEIRELFPALLHVEDLGDGSLAATGPHLTPAAAVAPAPLQQLGDYRILRLIGQGGMGVVYEAEQQALGRRVALKVLAPHALNDAQKLRRFEREARSAARLHHTNIVPVFGVGCHEGIHYYVMQFIQGLGLDAVLDELQRLRQAQPERGTLDREVPRRTAGAPSAGAVAQALLSGQFDARAADNDSSPEAVHSPGEVAAPVVLLPAPAGLSSLSESGRPYWQSVARIGIQAAEAFAYAHGHGILHRDIKPSNLLLDVRGTVWVTDFGLAKVATERDNLTHTGDIVGTIRYMAPERFEGRADARSDLYSLGLTLYEFLVLQPAFLATDRNKLIHQVMHDEPTPPRQLRPDIPRDLETIVLKAMARDPAHRYTSAAELAADLQRFVEDRPIRARRVSPAERLWRWGRRNPLVAALTAAMAAVGLGFLLTGGALWYNAECRAQAVQDLALAEQDLTAKRDEVRQLEHQGQEERRHLTEARETAQRLLYTARMYVAQNAWQTANVGQVLEQLDFYRPPRPAGERDWRGWEWYYQDRLCHADLRTLQGHTDRVTGVAFSPDGTQLASTSSDQTVKLWAVADGQELRTLKGHTSDVWGVAFSPDGSRLASASSDQTVKLWDAASGKELRTLRGHTGFVESVAFSADGTRVASSGGDQTVKVWDAASGQALRTLRGHTKAVYGVAFSPDGTRLASASLDGAVKLWEVASGAEIRTFKGHGNAVLRHGSYVTSVVFNGDGTQLATGGGDQTVKVWEVTSGQELRTLSGHTQGVMSVAFSPDGTQLASASGDGTVKVWEVASGLERATFRGHDGSVRRVAFSPDGTRLASASHDRTVKVWETASNQEVRTLTGHTSHVNSVAFSPDGAHLASASYRTVKMWETASGLELRTLRGHSFDINTVAYSPDGSWLASGSYDGTIKVWEATSGQELRTLRGHRSGVVGVAFSPDGTRLASASGDGTTSSGDGTVRVWELASGQEVRSFQGHAARSNWGGPKVAFSADGEWLALGSEDRTVKVWEVASGQELRTLRGHRGAIQGVAFSPAGSQLASASTDGTVKVWEVASGQELRTLRGHRSEVYSVAFSRDGSRLASASQDYTVKVWDMATGQELRTLRGHTSNVFAVAFSSDGWRLASTGIDQTVKIWDARPATLQLRMELEARGRAEWACAQAKSEEAARARLRSDFTLSELVRQQALTFVPTYWAGRRQAEASRLVATLFHKLLLKEEVLAALRADGSLAEEVRQRTLEMASRSQENASDLWRASWPVVSQPGQPVEAYRLALRQAEAASRLAPRNGAYLTTLGIAQYRLQQYGEALATLTRLDPLNAAPSKGAPPASLAFLAMTHHELGQQELAQAALNRLREIAQKAEVAQAEEIQSLLHEAETRIGGPLPMPKE